MTARVTVSTAKPLAPIGAKSGSHALFAWLGRRALSPPQFASAKQGDFWPDNRENYRPEQGE